MVVSWLSSWPLSPALSVSLPVPTRAVSLNCWLEPKPPRASRADCRFCRLLEQEVLKPLIRSGDYSGQFNLLPLPLDAPQGLVNFAGNEITVGELASRYQLQLTPTLVFVDDQGSELVPRLIGYQSGAYYEYYLEQAIRAAGTGTKPSAQALEDAGR